MTKKAGLKRQNHQKEVYAPVAKLRSFQNRLSVRHIRVTNCSVGTLVSSSGTGLLENSSAATLSRYENALRTAALRRIGLAACSAGYSQSSNVVSRLSPAYFVSRVPARVARAHVSSVCVRVRCVWPRAWLIVRTPECVGLLAYHHLKHLPACASVAPSLG